MAHCPQNRLPHAHPEARILGDNRRTIAVSMGCCTSTYTSWLHHAVARAYAVYEDKDSFMKTHLSRFQE